MERPPVNDHEELCALLSAKSTIEPFRVLQAVRVREAQIDRQARRRSAIELTTLAFGLVALLVCAIVFPNPVVIAAFAVYVVAAIPYAVVLVRHGRAAEAPAAEATIDEHFRYCRMELERERGLFPRLAVYVVPLVGSAVLAYVGLRAGLRADGMPTDVTDPLFAGFCGVAVVFLAGGIVGTMRSRRRLGREIGALES